jgi:hypothetical protein
MGAAEAMARIQNHRPKLVEQAHAAQPEWIRRFPGAAGQRPARPLDFLLPVVRQKLGGQWIRETRHLRREITQGPVVGHKLCGAARLSGTHES